jgi:steroid 5-alpha reductase family enzyme
MRYTGKDPRFATWKWQGFKALMINIVWIFGQTAMIAVMSYPVLLVNTNNDIRGLLWLDILGFSIWFIGFWYEAIADWQLFSFMKKEHNKDRVMRYGLWRYSRHPNYFGESLMWWGVYVVASSLPYGGFAIITPIVITFLLVYVTGIPWIEKAMAHNQEYKEYQKTTSKFIPWFVSKSI